MLNPLFAKSIPLFLFYQMMFDTRDKAIRPSPFATFYFPLARWFSPPFFVLKNQMSLTLKNCGTADDLCNTQKESQQSHPAHVCLQTHCTILITSILGKMSQASYGGWLVAQAVIPTFCHRSEY